VCFLYLPSFPSVDERWQGLNNALAGLFCASLSDLPNTRTSSPEYAFRSEAFLPSRIPHHLRHAVHPSEQICTENLTPFLKLLPCKGIAGLASLLNPHKLFDGDWHGIGVHVSFNADKGTQVQLTVGAVLDPVRTTGTRNWSFESLFGRNIEKDCVVMRMADIRLQQRTDIGITKPSPYPDQYERAKGAESWDRWNVRAGFALNSTFVDEDEEWSYRM
jgi:phosphatidylinositol glycan class T